MRSPDAALGRSSPRLLKSTLPSQTTSSQVLLIGGHSTHTELFDVEARRAIDAGDLKSSGLGVAFAPLPNNQVLVAGGYSEMPLTTAGQVEESEHRGRLLNSAQIFDPISHSTTEVADEFPRIGAGAVTLHDGRILIFEGYDDLPYVQGGETGSLAKKAVLFDPSMKQFRLAASVVTWRHEYAAVVLDDGRVLISGGFDVNHNLLNSTEIYDPASAHFTAGPAMKQPRANHTATLLRDSRILVAGGLTRLGAGLDQTAEIYDPTTGSFRETGSMHYARVNACAVLLADGRVLFAGGWLQRTMAVSKDLRFGAGIEPAKEGELYDPAQGTFGPAGEMPKVDANVAAIALPDGRALVITGANMPKSRDVLELFDASTKTFTAIGESRYQHGAGAVRQMNSDVFAMYGGGTTSVTSVQDMGVRSVY